MQKFDIDFTWFQQKYDSGEEKPNFIIYQELKEGESGTKRMLPDAIDTLQLSKTSGNTFKVK